ncbi:MAG: 5'/3'-nucleotidase SurE [Candidatus Helarchaeota archaeon]
MMERPRILITNDDGIESPSVIALKRVFNQSDYNVCMVIPSSQRSWGGKAISCEKCVSLEEVKCPDGDIIYSFTGTPADCIILGNFHLCDRKPDLIISGINYGANVGNSFVLSSATVGAAIEGSFLGIPSIAVSLLANTNFLRGRTRLTPDTFKFSANFTKKIADFVLTQKSLPKGVDVININIPFNADESSEVTITPIAKIHYGNLFREINKDDSKEQRDFIFSKMARGMKFDLKKDTDVHDAFVNKKIVISPISVQLTGDIKITREYFKSLNLK